MNFFWQLSPRFFTFCHACVMLWISLLWNKLYSHSLKSFPVYLSTFVKLWINLKMLEQLSRKSSPKAEPKAKIIYTGSADRGGLPEAYPFWALIDAKTTRLFFPSVVPLLCNEYLCFEINYTTNQVLRSCSTNRDMVLWDEKNIVCNRHTQFMFFVVPSLKSLWAPLSLLRNIVCSYSKVTKVYSKILLMKSSENYFFF